MYLFGFCTYFELKSFTMTSSPEADILAIHKGDRKAFKSLFDENFPPLCAFANRYLGDRIEAEDAVQESFISFWEQSKGFENLAAVKSYLYTSVRNKCLNLLKHRDVQRKHESSLIYELESDHIFQSHVIEEDAFNRLFTEIKQLPEASQQIMLLALRGMKNREIAEKLDISENTVKTQKKIAYAKLKDRLTPVLKTFLFGLAL